MRPSRSFSSDLVGGRCGGSLGPPLDLELVLEAWEGANVGVTGLGKSPVQANPFLSPTANGSSRAIMLPISSDLKWLKTLIVSIIASPCCALSPG